MTRTERLLRLARQRGDLLAVATLETAIVHRPAEGRIGHVNDAWRQISRLRWANWTEAELREAWGR